MQQLQARRTRSGQIVGVSDAMTIADLVGEMVELLGPNGDSAHARVLSAGRPFEQGGRDLAYAYVRFLTEDAA